MATDHSGIGSDGLGGVLVPIFARVYFTDLHQRVDGIGVWIGSRDCGRF